MTFLEKIKPHLLSDDILIQQTVLHALHDYPATPEEWTVELLKEAFAKSEKQSDILIYIDNQKINEEALNIILENIPNMDQMKVHLALKLVSRVEPSLALKYRERIEKVIPGDTWDLFELMENGSKDEVYDQYRKELKELEQGQYFQAKPYQRAKLMAKCIVEKGYITENEIEMILSEELKDKWFSYRGILTVYMIGLLGIEKHIPLLASLLIRDEDILLEETADALIQFQSDAVVEEVAPYVTKPESSIFAASVIENIKTDLAVQVLKEAYHEVEEIDEQEMIIEALCHHFSEEALPEVNEHMEYPYETAQIVDIEQVVYGFYSIMGEPHPDLSLWKKEALRKEMNYRKASENGGITLPVQKEKKVGRNDPCPCGSGKKYKKCCGK